MKQDSTSDKQEENQSKNMSSTSVDNQAEGGSQQDKTQVNGKDDSASHNNSGLGKKDASHYHETDDSAMPTLRLAQAHSVGPVIGEFSFLRKPELEKFDLKKKPLFIGVTGGTASGKTSICEIIKEEFGDHCCIVTFDSFYKGLSDEDHANASNYNFDSPNALDFDLAYEKIKGLLRYEDVEVPVYDFATHKRDPNKMETVRAQPLVIFEGIMALYEQRFRDMMDLKIFVLTDDDIRLARRIQRDIAERGRGVEDVLAQYNRFVKPSYDEFIKPTMKYADIIIPKGRSNTKGIDFVVSNLKIRVPLDELNENFSTGEFSAKKEDPDGGDGSLNLSKIRENGGLEILDDGNPKSAASLRQRNSIAEQKNGQPVVTNFGFVDTKALKLTSGQRRKVDKIMQRLEKDDAVEATEENLIYVDALLQMVGKDDLESLCAKSSIVVDGAIELSTSNELVISSLTTASNQKTVTRWMMSNDKKEKCTITALIGSSKEEDLKWTKMLSDGTQLSINILHQFEDSSKAETCAVNLSKLIDSLSAQFSS